MPAHSETLESYWAKGLRRSLDAVAPQVTDADRIKAYRGDPVGFARDVLGIWVWSKQALLLSAVLEAKRLACVSGHKVGKSTSLAILALWFYCSFPGARVVIMATTDRQVNLIIWREIKRLIAGALIPIPGAKDLKETAKSGLTDPNDFSEIRGYTAREAEAVAGISGAYIMYLLDEASGILSKIYEAIEGNRAAGNAWVFLISNPTRADGEFYDAHHKKSANNIGKEAGYTCFHIDSRDSPNVTGEWREMQEWDRATKTWVPRTEPVPGLAVPEWVAAKAREWGEDDPRFLIRVAGKFSVAEEAKVFKLELLLAAQLRFEQTEKDTLPKGRLFIGVDPAGDGPVGDKSAFAWRKGRRLLGIHSRRGISSDAHVAEVLGIISNAGSLGTPIVCLDYGGDIGSKVAKPLAEYLESHPDAFRLIRIRPSDKAARQPKVYGTMRDCLWANAKDWVKDDGAIPEHAELEEDLHAPEFAYDSRVGKLKLMPKDKIRDIIGRSPDMGDAFCLACWEPLSIQREESENDNGGAAQRPKDGEYLPEHVMDPYAAAGAMGR